jgi:ribonuclease HI
LKEKELKSLLNPKYQQEWFLNEASRNFVKGSIQPLSEACKIGPLIMSPSEANRVLEMQGTESHVSDIRIISSDGSLINADSDAISMAFGVVDQSDGTVRSISGKVEGYASSTKAELLGLLAAIIATPSNQNIKVELDNQAVVTSFKHLVLNREGTLPRKRFHCNYAGLWAANSPQYTTKWLAEQEVSK